MNTFENSVPCEGFFQFMHSQSKEIVLKTQNYFTQHYKQVRGLKQSSRLQWNCGVHLAKVFALDLCTRTKEIHID